MGLSDLLVREAAKDHQLLPRYFNNFLVLKFILSVITLITIGLSVVVHSYNIIIIRLIVIFGIGIVLESLNFLMKAVFQTYQQMRYEAYVLILEGMVRFLFVLSAINMGMGIIGVALAFFLSTLFGLIVGSLLVYLRFTKLRFEFDWRSTHKFLITALPFAGLNLLGCINLKIDTVMLMHLSGETSVGLFGAADRLIEPLLVIPLMLGISLAPAVSKAVEWKRNDIIHFLRRCMVILIFLCLPIVIVLITLAPSIFGFIFGIPYVGAIDAFRILIWYFPLFTLQFMWEKLLNGLRREVMTVIVYIIGMIINVILNILLIPKYGPIGSGVATLLAGGFILIALFYLIRINLYYRTLSVKEMPTVSLEDPDD
jgi:O-antigen/teichoic acid export membrane protein